MTTFDLRRRMIERQIAPRGIRDPNVLRALASVPREVFVPDELRHRAYEDGPLPIGDGQTISQPYIVAFMADALELKEGDHVLEVGAGSGYGAAVLAEIAERVVTVEREPDLAERARDALRRAGYEDRVRVVVADGSLGWPEEAPYDAVSVTAGSPGIPNALREQLTIGGRLLLPLGDRRGNQKLVRIRRFGPDAFEREDLLAVRFVPLRGEQGWSTA